MRRGRPKNGEIRGKMVNISFFADPDTVAALHDLELAEEEGRSEVIRKAIHAAHERLNKGEQNGQG